MKKHCLAKVLPAILHENNRNYNSFIFSYKFAFILFLPFLRNQNQESGFLQVGGVVTRNICFFYIASHALLQSHAEFNRLSERNFLTCYDVRIIVPW